LPGALEAFVAVEKAAPAVVRSAAGVVARNADLLGELAVLYQAEILESQEKWDAALQRYEQLLQRAAEAPRARESFVQDPYCRERIARLYWRLGRTDQALRILEAVLADTPDYPRAPLLRLVVLSLSRGAEGGEQSALAYLSAPLGATADAVADAPDAAGQSANPLLGPLRELSAGQPEGSAWLPVLRLRCGWMLLEAGQREEAREQFRLGSSLANGAGAGLAVVKSYADLSLALCCAHHGDPDQAARLARGIVAAGGRGPPQEVAAQILTGLGWYRDQQKKAEKCSVRPLP
jgi:tetratricopeptide (TPR) repeat protein